MQKLHETSNKADQFDDEEEDITKNDESLNNQSDKKENDNVDSQFTEEVYQGSKKILIVENGQEFFR